MDLSIGTMNITFLYQAGLPSYHSGTKLDMLFDHYVQMNGSLDTWRIFKSQILQLKIVQDNHYIKCHYTLPTLPTKISNQSLGRLLRKRTSLVAVNNVQNYTLTFHFRKRAVNFYFTAEA